MLTEIISIGSELTSGQNLDTNSQWLSRRLAEVGIPVGWHTTIADDFDDNVAAFRVATQRAGLVLATGGLGPTQDDLTREVLPRVAGAGAGRGRAGAAEDQLLRRRRVGAGGEVARPDAPRPRAGGRHHGVRCHDLAAHPGARG